MIRIDKKLRDIKDKRTWIVCFLCLTFVLMMESISLFPFETPLIGHDSQYHYLRVDALVQRIRDGNIFSGGIDYLFCDGLGYASSVAYPDILLYIPAILRLVGFGIGQSIGIFVILCNVMCICSSFLCMYKISKSPVCATVASVIFSTSFYRMDNIYTRFALGEVQAFIFWPIIIYGLYDFIFDDFKKPYVIGLGIVGMLLTHTISTVLAVILCVVMCLVFIKKILKDKKKILKLIITAACVLLITSFYWIPLLELMGAGDLTVAHPIYLAADNVIEFMSLFKDVSIMGNSAGLGILIFAVCGIRVFVKSKDENKEILKFADVCMILAFVFAFLTIKTPLWKVLPPLLNFMQFAWRMFAIVTLLISVAVSIYAYLLSENLENKNFVSIIFSVVFVLNAGVHIETIGVQHAGVYNDDYFTGNPGVTYSMGYGEWLPWPTKNAIDTVKENAHKVVMSDGKEAPFEKTSSYLVFLPEKTQYEYAIVPYLWYKGYVAYDEGGNEYETSMSDLGLVKVELDGKETEGNIYVEYQFTPLRICSTVISIISVLLLLAYFIFTSMKKKNKNNENNKEEVLSDERSILKL